VTRLHAPSGLQRLHRALSAMSCQGRKARPASRSKTTSKAGMRGHNGRIVI
jgi:hypothetical protein